MNETKPLDPSDILTNVIIEGMKNNKSKNIISLNLKEIDTSVCDYFIICHGNSNTHISSIANNIVLETIKTLNDKPFNKEGSDNGEWILLDYGNVVAHVFQEDKRKLYNLEELWGDAKTTYIKDIS